MTDNHQVAFQAGQNSRILLAVSLGLLTETIDTVLPMRPQTKGRLVDGTALP